MKYLEEQLKLEKKEEKRYKKVKSINPHNMLKNKEYLTEVKTEEKKKIIPKYRIEPPQLNVKTRRRRRPMTIGNTCMLPVSEDPVTFEIVRCNTTFDDKAGLKKHMAEHEADNEWACGPCQKNFGHYVNYHHHITGQQH